MTTFLAFLKGLFGQSQAVRLSLTALVSLAAVVSALSPFTGGVALVSGRPVVTTPGQLVSQTVAMAGTQSAAGDIVDPEGAQLVAGAGRPPAVTVNGSPAEPERRILPGDIVSLRPGGDIIEPLEVVTETLVAEPIVSGSGKHLTVAHQGSPGSVRKLIGVRSGQELASWPVIPAVPRQLVRADQAPGPVIALTFDDGPNPPYTEQIMKILDDLEVKATFFVIGRQAERYPETLRNMATRGFQISNHGYSHSYMNTMPIAAAAWELDRTGQIVAEASGSMPTWFRPPFGASSALLSEIAADRSYQVINWTVDSRDWMPSPPESLADNVIAAAQPEAVVLMHDGGGNRTSTVLSLPKIVEVLRGRGYTFVTVDELFSQAEQL